MTNLNRTCVIAASGCGALFLVESLNFKPENMAVVAVFSLALIFFSIFWI